VSSKLGLLTSKFSNPYNYIHSYFEENTYVKYFSTFILYLLAINRFSGLVNLECTNRYICTILKVFLNHSNKLSLDQFLRRPLTIEHRGGNRKFTYKIKRVQSFALGFLFVILFGVWCLLQSTHTVCLLTLNFRFAGSLIFIV
jgi:hypothetical protein